MHYGDCTRSYQMVVVVMILRRRAMVLRKFLHDWIHLSIVPNGVGTFEYAVGDSIVPHPVMTA